MAGSKAGANAPLFETKKGAPKKGAAGRSKSVLHLLLAAAAGLLVGSTGTYFAGLQLPEASPPLPLDNAAAPPARRLTEKPFEYRWHVNITAVETEPVELVDISAPGAGGNQASCAEGGADIEPGWVCVKRHRIERRPTISPEELKERYYKQGVPVILTDFVTKDWKVFTEDAWAPEKLRERFGDKMVNVQMGRESDPDFELNQHLLRKDMKFREYVDMVIDGGESNDYYLTANNHMLKNREFRSMLDDVQPFFPGFMQQSANLIGTGTYYWLGPKSTITPLHQDAASLFHVHMKGRKLWRFISPDQKHLVYNSFGVYSDVDLLLPWEELIAKYPLMAQATIITEVIQPGETIFIPNGWFHHVISLDHPTTSMSSTVFTHDFSGLEAHLYKRWNSLYKQTQDAGTTSMSPQQMRKKLTAFTNRARAVAPDAAQAAKDVVSTAIEQYQQAMSQGKLTFHPARKALFTAIAGNRDATGMLLWVLSQDDYNKMTTDWKNWLWTNIARNPPLNTIVEVMATQMNEKQDTDEIIQSWSAFQQTGREGRVAIQG
mmetsp:Transcript_16821/g.42161  ORF Transcript_16821/g.42161 Transcript_16821/m.42161 type:complete len:548 (-) Transcript_16821:255-1898(-)